jgi:hypothetical protein
VQALGQKVPLKALVSRVLELQQPVHLAAMRLLMDLLAAPQHLPCRKLRL